jgi:hypothetical protein
MVLDQGCLLNNSELFLSHFDHVHAIVDTYIYIYVEYIYIILYVSNFYLKYFLFVSKRVQYNWQKYYIEQKNETIKFAPYFASMYDVFWFSTYNIFGGDRPVHKLD